MKSRSFAAFIAISTLVVLTIPASAAQDASTQADGTATTTAANPVPLINQPLVPDAATPGGAGFPLTVNGTGFVSTSVVKWNGSARTTKFVSTSQLQASITASDIATARTASVTVVSPAPGGGTSNVVYFAVGRPTSSVSLRTNSYTAGSGLLSSLAIGDFNGDGKADLAMTDATGLNVSILLGNGDGTFQHPVTYSTGNASVATGDFNGDGKLDLALANINGSVSIMLGNGDGTFQPAVNYNAGSELQAVAVGDFNGDGKLDLAVADYSGSDVVVLLGNGDGSFQAPMSYSTGPGSLPIAIAVGDFNGDGKLDLVVGLSCTGCGSIRVLLGNGDGTFRTPVSYDGGGEPTSIAVGDFNGDGKLDLAISDISFATVNILKGNGDGTFQATASYNTLGGNAWVALGDLNGDGKLDIVVLNIGTSCNVNLLLGNGDGTFQPDVGYGLPSCNAGVAAGALGVADFNRDGKLDLAVAPPGSSTFSVLLQAPTVSVSPTSLAFAGQVIGTSSSAQQIRLTNTGYLKLSIAAIKVSGTNVTDFNETNNCPSTLAIGASCMIGVTFAPTQIGPRTANVTITDNAPNSPQSVGLNGVGVVTGPNVTLSTTSLSFSTQLVGTRSSAQTVTLNNYGSTSLSITSISVTGADPADFAETNSCGSSVSSTGSCTISVTFQPRQRGSRAASLTLTDNAPGSPQTFALNGTGTVVTLSPSSLNFGNVTIGQRKTLTSIVTNLGSTTMHITSITITGQYSSEVNTCPAALGAHSSCDVNVTFAPGGSGMFSGTVSISDDGGGSPQQVSLSGTGLGNCNGHPCFGRCPPPCSCVFGICRGPSSAADMVNELFFNWDPTASFYCGGSD